ncbi:response regulator [Paenibacillus sp. N3/727]|uniref:response regulator transcription factor n=1 Tax=Paenibacillus sp. N3/727 TaxID=2925845 RepID=UPI001F53ABE8|nr:response regulator [Paenibacillus sp. N3/727]UNK19463.1 response regulator [Paenibacillus sp. N3/727]
MWQVLIMDDEKIIRNGLRKFIQESRLPFEPSGEARNATEALSLIEQSTPDVLLADINMPGLNGLDLVQLVASRYPDMVVVIISGYDDFKYAQRALQLHAYDYLLKPVPKSDLNRMLAKLHDHLCSLHPDKVTKLKKEMAQESLPNSCDLSPIMVKITEYIHYHYNDPELAVPHVAELFHINSNYLSKRMKKEVGVSFLEYLTELRISKAKELLDNSMQNIKIGDLAIKVGYMNQYYFSRLFKNRVGMCPVDYKNSTRMNMH